MPPAAEPHPPVMPPAGSALAYHDHRLALTAQVDANFARHPDLGRFLGPNPFDLLRQNHDNHSKFMDNVFFLGNGRLLQSTIPWVYRAYGAREVAMDYFPAELQAWKEAIDGCIPGREAGPLHAVYDWMLAQHGSMLARAASCEAAPGTADPASLDAFVEALLRGDREGAETLAGGFSGQPEQLEHLYLDLLDPAMQRIGLLWEQARISVVEEHIASSRVTRMMSMAFAHARTRPDPRKRCIICAGPEEQHQLGAWMVSDLLELRGWSCRFPGADSPADALLALVDAFRPRILALSLTMPFHLRGAADLIARLRRTDSAASLRIMVGGRVFQETPGLAARIGADGEARDARGACLLAETWFEADLGRP